MKTWIREPSGVSRGWKTEIKIKHLLGEDDRPPAVAFAARAIHKTLEEWRTTPRGGWDFSSDEELEQISDEFHTIGYVDGEKDAEVGYFNTLLENLYDWADEERVIIA